MKINTDLYTYFFLILCVLPYFSQCEYLIDTCKEYRYVYPSFIAFMMLSPDEANKVLLANDEQKKAIFEKVFKLFILLFTRDVYPKLSIILCLIH